MLPNAKETVLFILNNPLYLANKLGFDLLKENIHGVWITDWLSSEDEYLLQAHRESYKTTCLAITIAIRILLEPNKPQLLMRKTDDAIATMVRAISGIINTGYFQEFSRRIWGTECRILQSNQGKIQTSLMTSKARREPSFMGLSIGSSGLTGLHFPYIYTDDIVGPPDRYSVAERKKTKRVYQELQNILMDGGVMGNTGTPWHKDDAFSLMPKARTWSYKDTNLLSKETIEKRRKKMSSSLFAANYELKHIADESRLFYDPPITDEWGSNVMAHVDAAYGGADTTALTLLSWVGNKKTGKLIFLFKCWEKHVQDCYADIIRLMKYYKAGSLRLERNGDKGYVQKDLQKLWPDVIGYNESGNKHIKIASYLRGVWDRSAVHQDSDIEAIGQVIDYEEGIDPDDVPDSAASLIREGGFSVDGVENTLTERLV